MYPVNPKFKNLMLYNPSFDNSTYIGLRTVPVQVNAAQPSVEKTFRNARVLFFFSCSVLLSACSLAYPVSKAGESPTSRLGQRNKPGSFPQLHACSLHAKQQ
jgi:hypothetical protein